MNKKRAFVMYFDWEEVFDTLENEMQVVALLKALFAFARDGKITKLNGATKTAFVIMSKAVERDTEKWEERRKKNAENATKRWNAIASERKQPHTNHAVNVNEKDKDNEIVRGSVIVNSPSPSKAKLYGEYQHVQLTDKDYNDLLSTYGETLLTDYIRRVDEYCETHGANYNNHAAIIKSWLGKDKPNVPDQVPSSVDVSAWYTLADNYDPETIELKEG